MNKRINVGTIGHIDHGRTTLTAAIATVLSRKFSETPVTKKVFVFGSNLAGVHGAGAAQFAKENRGAIWGQGIGLQGQSYGIPTKDERIQTLPLGRIRHYVLDFLDFAKANPEMTFEVTRIGCGLAGYTPKDIAPMFEDAPANCELPEDFKLVLEA